MAKQRAVTVTMTDEQLKLIADACELASRLRSGQLHELDRILVGVANHEGLALDRDEMDSLIVQVKSLIGLPANGSIGIRQSTSTAKKLYEIYYMIRHYYADPDSINVYNNKLLKVTNDKLIQIE